MIVNICILILLIFHKCPFFTENANVNQTVTISNKKNSSLPFNMENKDLALHVLPFL